MKRVRENTKKNISAKHFGCWNSENPNILNQSTTFLEVPDLRIVNVRLLILI